MAVPGTSRCRAHTTYGWDSKPKSRDAAYADPVYRANRARILAGKPICVYPGCTKVADTVDHVRPVVGGVDNSLGNLRPVCRKHNEALGRDLCNQRKRRKRRE